ncbi:MAG: globin-coupled sensor protein [Pseudorhodoplanes sp.]|nr:Heme-based aerotactic transducer HemAT [Pseudorhodoplanes sp.]MBW7948433.1 globin-coupled sensor protein [Pseudorhodoplanes sp.]MCL4711313.1 globin-coupled sensor protein [Pseudorhodoplanes sp.]GIK81958.1 MAG: hypothetical protein BroJett024_30630 [Alphaproteobacteria bacterium]
MEPASPGSQDTSIASRVQFCRIDGATSATLRELKPLVLRELPGILDNFYGHIAQCPDVAKFFGSEQHMRHAREMQLRHWSTIVSGTFDNTYMTSVTRIGEAHNRLGLEPCWYIGGYSYILGGLLEAIVCRTSGGWSGAAQTKKAQMISAILKAALLDMDLAISVYLDAGVRDKRETLAKLAASFEDSVGGIVEAVSSSAAELKTAAGTLSQTADTTQQLTNVVADASREASSNIQSVAVATEELNSSIAEIGARIHESNRITNDAVAQAKRTDELIGDLSKAAQKIGDVIKLITDIAGQTNLLALNATIEAARAGEAGRGFAVVASEVKALASQTARATGEISEQISNMQAATQESVSAINEIGATIQRIFETSTAIAAAVEEQASATQEIARNVQHTADGTSRVSANIDGVNSQAAEIGSASTHVLGSANSLATESDRLKGEVGKFLKTVRCA